MGQAYRVPKRTILCIDENDATLAYLKSLMERSGYAVLTASSAAQGIGLASMFDLDAVVLDYHLPEMSGHHVAVAIKRCQPRALIVMFSGSDVPDETRQLVDAVVLR
ncbi:MAG: response regulator [Acidobacteria bacterium]|nr:response regulator [Acidobacteriota bacterium]